MNIIPGLTRTVVEAHTANGSLERGEAYVRKGAVRDVRRVGVATIEAQVQGGQAAPYIVRVAHDEAGIAEVQCSCPFHAGHWCKHIAAALLTCLEQEAPLETDVAALLNGMDRAALVALIEALASDEPALVERIEAYRS